MFTKLLGTSFILFLLLQTLGCVHPMRIRHTIDKRFTAEPLPIKLGIYPPGGDEFETELIDEIGQQARLSDRFADVRYPANGESGLDYSLEIEITIDKTGTFENFFITWPGYYIFTPAWHGFKYNDVVKANVHVKKSSTRSSIGSFRQTENIRINHADLNRTWVQAGWLWLWPIWDLVAIPSGAVNTRYDRSITEEAISKYKTQMALQILNESARVIEDDRNKNETITEPASGDLRQTPNSDP